ncbi:MAG TPA: hypothetical protein DEF45_21360 [Rhodopirellula sp.]|nr:hypothetical protein [Rhodopirellula sp.]
MIRCWLIPILLLVALDTRVFAEAAGNALSVAATRVDQDGSELPSVFQDDFIEKDVVDNAVQVAQASSDSLLNWYGSDAVYNVRLVLAGALGFLLVLLALHLFLPSTAGRSSDQTQAPTCSAGSCACHHGQQMPNGNDAAVQHSTAGADSGNFLPLGISLSHLNALGQRTSGQLENNTGQFDELTLKVKALEEQLRQVTGRGSGETVDDNVTSTTNASVVEKPVEKPVDTQSPVSASVATLGAGDATSDQEQEGTRAAADSHRQGKCLADSLFDGVVSETLAVIHSE